MSQTASALKKRVRSRAQMLGTTVRALLTGAGLGHDLLHKTRDHHVLTLERLAAACSWTLPELLGFSIRTDLKLAHQAFATARNVQRQLPPDAHTDDILIEIYAHIYDALNELRAAGENIDQTVLHHYEQMLSRTWLTWAMRGDPDKIS